VPGTGGVLVHPNLKPYLKPEEAKKGKVFKLQMIIRQSQE
jgi:hypothetical protein